MRWIVDYFNRFRQHINGQLSVITIIFCTAAIPLLAGEIAPVKQPNNNPDVIRSVAQYMIPETVEVVRMDGKNLPFINEIDDGRPVIMNFIFASCSAICPMLSYVFSQVQTKLAKDKVKAHLISVSIDPENDTPVILREYAKKFKAGAGWDFYTGSIKSSVAIQKAFNVFRGDKMNHASIILMRKAPGQPWLRLEGFVSPDEAVQEYVSMDLK
jgi:protein SCO1/2